MTRLLLVVFLLAQFNQLAVGHAPAPARATVAAPKHLEVAQQLVSHLDLASTDYAHGAPQVSFVAPFESHADCSGFADALLEYSYGLDKQEFRKLFGSGRPTAARYYDAIENQAAFKLVPHVQDIRPGDFLAVKYLTRKDNTGHVMVAAGRPAQMERPKDPGRTGAEQWKAPNRATGRPIRDTKRARTARITTVSAKVSFAFTAMTAETSRASVGARFLRPSLSRRKKSRW
jgi:hypothetical protein